MLLQVVIVSVAFVTKWTLHWIIPKMELKIEFSIRHSFLSFGNEIPKMFLPKMNIENMSLVLSFRSKFLPTVTT